MAPDEEVLDELYELLGLYFGLDVGGGIVKADKHSMTEPALDRVIFREKLLTRITTLIMAEFLCNSKGEDK